MSPDGKNYEWNEQKNTYEQLTRDDNGKIVRTPRTNKWMLMNAGTWQQGYRIDNYEITEPSEKELQTTLQVGINEPKSVRQEAREAGLQIGFGD